VPLFELVAPQNGVKMTANSNEFYLAFTEDEIVNYTTPDLSIYKVDW
jgi:hypothetical protein